MKSEDWIGTRFGDLEIVSFEGLKEFSRGKSPIFRFRCTCGKEIVGQKSNVHRGKWHCGCKSKKRHTCPQRSSSHPVYKIWIGILNRCDNPKTKSFKDYGARGIRVCERWRLGDAEKTGFEHFVDDMGPRPANYTIERISPDGGYQPDNCVWIPKRDQSKNRRGVRLVRIGNRTQTMPDWCLETGISYWTAIRRVHRGWPPEKAVTYPVRGAA